MSARQRTPGGQDPGVRRGDCPRGRGASALSRRSGSARSPKRGTHLDADTIRDRRRHRPARSPRSSREGVGRRTVPARSIRCSCTAGIVAPLLLYYASAPAAEADGAGRRDRRGSVRRPATSIAHVQRRGAHDAAAGGCDGADRRAVAARCQSLRWRSRRLQPRRRRRRRGRRATSRRPKCGSRRSRGPGLRGAGRGRASASRRRR